MLIPDLQQDIAALDIVLAARSRILNHNLETVARLQPTVRQADYARSLGVLRHAAPARASNPASCWAWAKRARNSWPRSMICALRVTLLTLRRNPARLPRPIIPWRGLLPPEEFAALHEQALALGFVAVAAGPQVRSSYHAGELVARGKVS